MKKKELKKVIKKFTYKNKKIVQCAPTARFFVCLVLFYNSAISSTSQRTPFGKSFTATQLLAGFDVKYLP